MPKLCLRRNYTCQVGPVDGFSIGPIPIGRKPAPPPLPPPPPVLASGLRRPTWRRQSHAASAGRAAITLYVVWSGVVWRAVLEISLIQLEISPIQLEISPIHLEIYLIQSICRYL